MKLDRRFSVVPEYTGHISGKPQYVARFMSGYIGSSSTRAGALKLIKDWKAWNSRSEPKAKRKSTARPKANRDCGCSHTPTKRDPSKAKTSTRRTSKARALASLEKAWIQHFKSGSLRAKHGGQRVHDSMQTAVQAGATDSEINKVIDRAGDITARHRGEQYRKYLATGGSRRDVSTKTRRQFEAYIEQLDDHGLTKPNTPFYSVSGEIDRDPGSRRGSLRPKTKRPIKRPKKSAKKKAGRDMTKVLVPPKAGCPIGTEVQSVILSQQFFTEKQAEGWVRRHGFRVSKIDETKNNWRFRQHPPSNFEEGSFRTIRFRPGVEAVIGCPR